MGSAVLKRYAEDGEPAAERIVVEYALDELTCRMEDRLNEVLLNLPNRALARLLTMLVLPQGRHARLPSDEQTVAVAALFSTSSAVRTRLCADIFTGDPEHVIGWLDEAMALAEWAEPVERRIAHAQREGRLETESGADEAVTIRSAVSAGLVTDEEAQRLTHYHELVARIVAVDDFDSGELGVNPPVDNENDRVNAWRDSERRSFSEVQSERKR